MPGCVREGDVCTGHGCYPPRPPAAWSPNVYYNGLAAHRVGDSWASHCCGPPCHGGTAVSGSPNVFVNGQAQFRRGDPVDCGSSGSQRSANVYANG